MKLHPRYFVMADAKRKICQAVHTIAQELDLTEGELIGILSEEIAGIAKYMRRDERHPGDPGAGGDEAPDDEA